MCSGRVITSNTSCLGASNRRVSRISSSDGWLTSKLPLFAVALATMMLLLSFQALQIAVHAIQALLPDVPVVLGKGGHGAQRGGVDLAGPPLRLLPARDQAGALQHAQVLRHGGQAHVE